MPPMLCRISSREIQMLLLGLAMFGLFGCDSSETGIPAPIGDHAALEELATAYRRVSEEYPVRPDGMRPKARKQFIQQVFVAAGYQYEATLSAFAGQGVDVTNQDQRDLAELLFLPHRGLSETDMEKLYSAEELKAIRALQVQLK